MSEGVADPAGRVDAEQEPDQTAAPDRRSPRRGMLSRLRPQRSVTVPREIDGIVRLVRAQHPKTDSKAIVKAYELAQVAHTGQVRKSGEEFIEHPVGVARILAEQGMDATTIIAAFLHDTVEDTDLELAEVREEFGSEVAAIIDGLTKIERIRFKSVEQEQAENLRKMIIAMAQDLRVLVIKLADRLHNMRTLQALESGKREMIAGETLEIYAPLASRLAMHQIKTELEDLAFKALYPKRFQEIEQLVSLRQPEREAYLKEVISAVGEKLREVRVKAEVTGRHKHHYSIYKKMVGRELEFDEIFDLVGVRIVVENIRDCWAALGAVHSRWKPIPGRFKDYVANPKFNVYQSLHTTVVGPEGKPLEIQIRTGEMHQIAEWGVASHWLYKEGFADRSREEQAAWMNRMLDLQQTEDDAEFLQSLRLDLFADEVFVFTPKGDVVQLPKGATPIDFAYAIHTEVGHACAGARVEGKLVPLDFKLSSGQTVEVLTSRGPTGPSRDWLKVVATPRARTKIKQWFTKERREEAIAEGREAISTALRRAKLPQQAFSDGSLEAVSEELKFPHMESLYQSVGEGRQSVQSLITRLARLHAPPMEEEEVPAPERVRTRPTPPQGVIVRGIDDVWVKLARCCMPVPGDSIIGFVTRGRGVSVHRTDCPNSTDLASEPGRLIEVSWDPTASGVFPVTILVEALDRPKLLRDVTTAISDLGVNISSATASASAGIANLRFTFEVADPTQLDKIIATVRKIEAVFDAFRITPARN
ncbi:MAG: RelA/SpoT family protein [Actinomycetota bacterium]